MITRFIVAIILSVYFAYKGLKKKSLDRSGAIAAFITGFATAIAGYRFAAILILFYLSSSYFTKYKSEIKKKLEADFKEGGQRDWIQVFCNSGPATLAAFLYILVNGEDEISIDFSKFPLQSSLLAFYLGYYATCCADTWASELGILSKGKPFLITTFKTVPAGTNGGVSLLGCGASIAGGLFIGIVYCVFSLFFTPDHNFEGRILLVATIGGFLGSIIDSLLGATLQYSGWHPQLNKVVNEETPNAKRICGRDVLSNNQVNLISAVITGFLTIIVAKGF